MYDYYNVIGYFKCILMRKDYNMKILLSSSVIEKDVKLKLSFNKQILETLLIYRTDGFKAITDFEKYDGDYYPCNDQYCIEVPLGTIVYFKSKDDAKILTCSEIGIVNWTVENIMYHDLPKNTPDQS